MEPPIQDSSLFDLKFDETAKDHLRTMASWAIIVAVTAIAGYIITILRYVSAKNPLLDEYERMGISVQNKSNLAGTIVQIVIGLILNFILIRFALMTKKGINGINQPDLNRGLGSLKGYFTFIGVLLIIGIVFLLLGILIGRTGTM